MSKGLILDYLKCTGCRSCEVACSTFHESESNPSKSRVRVVSILSEYFYSPIVCQQCEKPQCAIVCPAGAITRNDIKSRVEIDESKCVGCKLCTLACPLGAISIFDGVSKKCDLCDNDPTCVKFCDAKALIYQELSELGEGKRERLSQLLMKASRSLLEEKASEQARSE